VEGMPSPSPTQGKPKKIGAFSGTRGASPGTPKVEVLYRWVLSRSGFASRTCHLHGWKHIELHPFLSLSLLSSLLFSSSLFSLLSPLSLLSSLLLSSLLLSSPLLSSLLSSLSSLLYLFSSPLLSSLLLSSLLFSSPLFSLLSPLSSIFSIRICLQKVLVTWLEAHCAGRAFHTCRLCQVNIKGYGMAAQSVSLTGRSQRGTLESIGLGNDL